MLEDVVGRNLKRKRMIIQSSLENFSGYSNSDAGHVGRIERGQHNATLATLKKIINPFSMQLHELFNEAEFGEDYTTLNRFINHNFPYIKQSSTAYLVIDHLSQMLLECLTTKDIERGALSVNSVSFSACEMRDQKHVVSYGIQACYEYDYGKVIECIHDITMNKRKIERLIYKLKDSLPAHEHFHEVIEDMVQGFYCI